MRVSACFAEVISSPLHVDFFYLLLTNFVVPFPVVFREELFHPIKESVMVLS